MLKVLTFASLFLLQNAHVEAFMTTPCRSSCTSTLLDSMRNSLDNSDNSDNNNNQNPKMSQLVPVILSAGIIGSSIFFPNTAFADEIGRETESPTLFTGETVLVCNNYHQDYTQKVFF